MARHLPLVTNSSMKTYRRCAREYEYRYERGLSPVGERALTLRFGSMLHRALEVWSLTRHQPDGIVSPLDAAIIEIAAANAHAPESERLDAYEIVRLEEMLAGYDARWADDGLEVVSVEDEFRAPLRNPVTGAASRTFQLGGKIDLIVRRNGRPMLMEHKSSSEDIEEGSTYWRRLLLDPQVSTYYVGADALGHRVEGCLYDVVGKPRIRPAKATPVEARKYTKSGDLYANQRSEDETPEEFRVRVREAIIAEPDRYYRRGEVVRLEEEERDAAFDAWGTARAIAESRAASRFPRNPDACERFGRLCDYFDLCTRVADAADPTRFSVREWPHSELTQPPPPDAVEADSPTCDRMEA